MADKSMLWEIIIQWLCGFLMGCQWDLWPQFMDNWEVFLYQIVEIRMRGILKDRLLNGGQRAGGRPRKEFELKVNFDYLHN